MEEFISTSRQLLPPSLRDLSPKVESLQSSSAAHVVNAGHHPRSGPFLPRVHLWSVPSLEYQSESSCLMLLQIAAKRAAETEAHAKKEADAAAAELAKATESKIKPRKSKKSTTAGAAAGSAAKKGHTVGSTTGDAARDRKEATAKERRREVIAQACAILKKGELQRQDHVEMLQRFEALSLDDNLSPFQWRPMLDSALTRSSPFLVKRVLDFCLCSSVCTSIDGSLILNTGPPLDTSEKSRLLTWFTTDEDIKRGRDFLADAESAALAALEASLSSKDYIAICKALFKARMFIDKNKLGEVHNTLLALHPGKRNTLPARSGKIGDKFFSRGSRVKKKKLGAFRKAASAGDVEAIFELAVGLDSSPLGLTDFASLDYYPLWAASMNGHVEMVKELVAGGADVDKVNPASGKSPVCAASERGHVGCWCCAGIGHVWCRSGPPGEEWPDSSLHGGAQQPGGGGARTRRQWRGPERAEQERYYSACHGGSKRSSRGCEGAS